MPRKMIAYDNLLALDQSEPFKAHRKALHICATKSLTNGVCAYYRALIEGEIKMAGQFINTLLGTWSKPSTKLAQFTRLTPIIREEAAEHEGLAYAFRHNQQEVILTMRILTEIGVSPNEVNPRTPEEQLFQRVWLCMEKLDSSFGEVRQNLQSPAWILRRLFEVLGAGNVPEEVVLHGFYFISPLQHRILSLLDEAGVNLVFLNLYDSRYPSTFGSVDAFLSPWVPKEQWEFSRLRDHELNFGDCFSAAFEGKKVQPDSTAWEPTINMFTNFSAFLDHYLERKAQYFSPKQDALNKRLKDYVPEAFEERHFLAYPIGQHLLHLHGMWDERKERLILTHKGLFECFSSGWLFHEGKNARDFIYQLQCVLPFFEGCNTDEQWKKRNKQLLAIKEGVVEAFEHSENRFHKMAENPMLRFSYFSLPISEIRTIAGFIEKLFVQAELLFVGAKQVTIHEHFRKIEKLMNEGIEAQVFVQEEIKLLEELRERLSIDFTSDEAFYIQDLSYAISLYLGGGFLKDDHDPKKLAVQKFDDADGAALEGAYIHLCGIDEDSLPYTAAMLPWPLTRDTLSSLNRQDEISMLFIREQMAPQIARYLYFSVLAFADHLEISWIQNMDSRKYEESLYITLLGLKPEPVEDDFKQVTLAPVKVESGGRAEALEAFKNYPVDTAAEFALCHRRFYYSFLAQAFATFLSDFHHQFLFGVLLKAGYRLSDSPDEEVTAQISDLFPNWTAIRKRTLAEAALENKEAFSIQYDTFDGKDYVRGRKDFQFLVTDFNSLMSPVKEAFRTQNVRALLVEPVELETSRQMEAKASKICRFCPHLAFCKEGFFAIDDKLRAIE